MLIHTKMYDEKLIFLPLIRLPNNKAQKIGRLTGLKFEKARPSSNDLYIIGQCYSRQCNVNENK